MKKLQYLCIIGIILGFSPGLMAQSTVITEDKPVYSVEQMPQYPGGEAELLKFIKDNLKYPKVAVETGIEGRVYIRFVVSRTGEVTDVTVIRSLDPSCDAEAVRVIKKMPTWTPGRQNGMNIPVYYTIPIVYKLNKSTSNGKTPLLIVDGTIRPYSLLKDTVLLKPSDILSLTVMKDSAALAAFGINGANGVIKIVTKSGVAKRDSAQNSDKPVFGVEVMPKFPGGENALMWFIKNNLHYPLVDAERGIEGRTTIRFVVTKTGKVSDIFVIRGLSPGCDAEAIRVIRLMPNWIPGTQKGKPVNVYYTLPFVFKLQK